MSSDPTTTAKRWWQRVRTTGKAVLMPALAARSLTGGGAAWSRPLLAAQVFSWGGDVALIGRTRGRFLAGLGSFLVAQVAYVCTYRARCSAPVLGTRGRRLFLLTGGLAAAGMGWAAAREDPASGMPVAAYGVTLSAMVATAAAIDHDRGRSQVLAGAGLFFVSDTLIGVRRFLCGDRAPVLEGAIAATYATGQWCISQGLRERSRAEAA